MFSLSIPFILLPLGSTVTIDLPVWQVIIGILASILTIIGGLWGLYFTARRAAQGVFGNIAELFQGDNASLRTSFTDMQTTLLSYQGKLQDAQGEIAKLRTELSQYAESNKALKQQFDQVTKDLSDCLQFRKQFIQHSVKSVRKPSMKEQDGDEQ